MKRLILPLMLAASPAFAQDRMDIETCENGYSAVMSMVTTDPVLPEFNVSDDGWCEMSGLEVPVEHGTWMAIETVRWRAADMDRVFELGLPPRAFELTVEGIALSPKTGDPVFDYLFGLQSGVAPGRFGVAVRWDGVQNAVIVDDIYVEMFGENRVSATARIDGVDLTDMSAIQMSAGSAGLSSLNVVSEFDGWFEAYAAMAVGKMILQDRDAAPEAQVEQAKQQAVEFISQIPGDIMPETSRDAMSAFVMSLPRPRGKAQVQISGEPVIGMARMMPFALVGDMQSLLETIPVALDGVNLLFTWTPNTGD